MLTFTYEPDDPDPEHSMGVSEAEYERLTARLIAIGPEDIEVEAE